jgi:hypothetical protein
VINFCFRVYRKLVYPAHKSFLSVVFFVVIVFLGFVISSLSVRAEGYPKYGPNETVIIGEFIYNDDFEPATSSCSIIVQNTAGAVVVPTTTLAMGPNGWQSYTFGATSTEGTWPTTIVCGSLAGGDLAKLDKTFIIGNTAISTSSIASSVWDSAVRTLTSGVSIADDIWAASSRTLTTFGSIVSDIWTSPTRSLTTFGTLLADIWSDGASPTRTLTSSALTSGGTLATETFVSSAINSATSTIISEIIENRSLISVLNNISAADVWASANRSLTDYATTSIASGVWSYSARGLTDYGNDITALDVWNAANRTLTDYATSSISSAVWDIPTSSLYGFGTIGKQIVDNLDAQISSRGTSTLTAADVWSAATRSLTDYSTTSIALGVWANSARTLTSYGNDITAADVWNAITSTLTTVGSIGEQLANNIDTTISSRASLTGQDTVLTEVLENQSLISALNDISAADVWSAATRSLTDYSTTSIALGVWANSARTLTSYGNDITAADVWNAITSTLTTVGSIGEQLANNIDTTISSRASLTGQDTVLTEVLENQSLISALNDISAADVWSAATRSLTDYSTSTIVSAVWNNASRTLTNYGNDVTAADVWNVMTSTLNTIGSIGVQLANNIDVAISTRASSLAQEGGWTVRMSDVDSVSAGKTYRTKVYIFDNQTIATAPASVPTISLYDASRNVVVSGVSMNLVSTGVYEYTYSVANNAEGGLWEAIISTEVESGQVVETNDYWLVASSPAQVLINTMVDSETPSISANVTITNEGLSGYEYQYEWCVVTNIYNPCGDNDDVYHASAAKFINPGEDFNTTLTAVVPTAGSYYFKLVVYFGTESSGASRTFVATAPATPPSSGGGGGGRGGGAFTPPTTPIVAPTSTPVTAVCTGADFNHDKKVNSIDFSILLAFWKTTPPFRNPCVDINKDEKVDSVDFSILMYNWGKNN